MRTSPFSRLHDLRVWQKLLVLSGVFVASLVGMTTYTVRTLGRQKSDGLVINIAGRQRMLTQKYTKEVLDEYVQRLIAHGAQAGGRSQEDDVASEEPVRASDKTRELFETSLASLRRGGATFSDLGMTEPVHLPPLRSAEVDAQLAQVEELWSKVVQAAETTREAAVGSEEGLAAVQALRELNVGALKAMNEGVQMLTEGSAARVSAMMRNECVLLVGVVLLGGSLAYSVSRRISESLSSVVAATRGIAAGDLDAAANLTPGSRDETGQVIESFLLMHESLRIVREELAGLSKHIQDGNLRHRCDASSLQGCWEELLVGVNGLADSYSMPIQTTQDCLGEICRGRIPQPIREEFRGDFDHIKTSLNDCIGTMNGLIAESNRLIHGVRDGDLGVRGDASRFEGSWAELVTGMDAIVRAFAAPIAAATATIERISRGDTPDTIAEPWKGDFERIRSGLNGCISTMNSLASEAARLIDAARHGNLEARADQSAFQGRWAEMIDGIQSVMEAVSMPLGETTSTMEALANKDLTRRMRGRYEGAFAALQRAVNDTLENLTEVVTVIHQSADEVSNHSSASTEQNHELSQRNESQAASLEQTAASMQELTSTVVQSAGSAASASQLAEQARDQAVQGSEILVRTAEAMKKISESSNRISNIIGVIDEIAMQTNLLALNASVEAARAGEHGRGFAVVASEVRDLAQRSATAAQEVQDLIAECARRVGEGDRLVQESGQTLRKIVDVVKNVSTSVAAIASASDDQAAGIEQVNTAIDQVSAGVQENQQMVASVSEGAKRLDKLARRMARLTGGFVLDSQDEPGDAPGLTLVKGPTEGHRAAAC